MSALLEDRLLTLLQRLGPKPPTVYARLGPAGLVDELEKAAPSDEEVWDGFPLWLADVRKGFEWRNDVVHNLWPAQPGDRLYGHRVDQRTGMRRTTDTTTDELPRQLRELVMLVDQWETWFALANSPLRRTR